MDQSKTNSSDDFKARPYQIRLFEKCVKENTIIYLPTGTGKTYIAVLLIKKMSNCIQKAFDNGGKRTVFVVNTVSLVQQHCSVIARHTGFICKGFTGNMNVKLWKNETWLQEIKSNQVLVMTAQIFLDLLETGTLPLQKVNLLIFDECHSAVKKQTMRRIMQRFEYCPQSQQPRVLAMTAALLNANVKPNKIEKTLKELEMTFLSKIATVESLDDVASFATSPQESIITCDSASNHGSIIQINHVLDHAQNVLQAIKLPNLKEVKLDRCLLDIKKDFHDMGLMGGDASILFRLTRLNFELIKNSSCEQTTGVIQYIITQLMKVQKIVADNMTQDLSSENFIIAKWLSPKIIELVHILYEAGKNFRCITFAQRKSTVKILWHILKKLSECNENLKFLRPDFMLGYNNDPSKNLREVMCQAKWNDAALARFKNGTVNCMVATNVIDEGVDVPSCTLVIRFDPPNDFRSYIQSKGRARHSTSRYITLLEKGNDADEYAQRHKLFLATEYYLKESLLNGKADLRPKPSEQEVKENLYTYKIKPYEIRKSDGSKSILTEHNAVTKINEYCVSLVKSKFVSLAPVWVKTEHKSQGYIIYKVDLTLPPVSPLRYTVSGDAFRSLNDAKRSAAFKTCVKLFELGQLDENFKPVKVEDSLKAAKNLFPNLPDLQNEEPTSAGISGTNKKRRRHTLVNPEQFTDGYPKAAQKIYLHIIETKPTSTRPDENWNGVFYDLLNSNHRFGILSANKLPEIPTFPVYMNFGELEVKINVNNKINSLEFTQLDALREFHSVVFKEILKIVKKFTVFDPENSENSFLIVPTIGTEIDWTIVDRYNKELVNLFYTKLLLNIRYSDYYYTALIRLNYRSSNIYLVTQIREDLKPESIFPSAKYNSFVDYYKQKHGIEINDLSQPLLEVKQISENLNFIKPRNINATERSSVEHLIPELCKKIYFPASYWLKATLLPSILHRIFQFLKAENLRREISLEADLNLGMPGADTNWNLKEMEDHKLSSLNGFVKDRSFDADYDFQNCSTAQDMPDLDVLNQRITYSWTPEEEPLDLDRMVDSVQQINLKHYYDFISKSTKKDKDLKCHDAAQSTYKYAPKIFVPVIKMLNRTSNSGPSIVNIMQTLTAKVSNDVFDFERAETLGDSFLKFAVSLFLYQTYPDYGEGPLTFLKGKLVGNMNLFYCGEKKQIPGRLNVQEFSPSDNFVAPCYSTDRQLKNILIENQVSANILYEITIPSNEKFSLSAETIDKINSKVENWKIDTGLKRSKYEHFLGFQTVSDKTVSDSVEAIIGTYLSHLGVEGALKILKYFEILPKSLNIDEFLNSEPSDPCVGTYRNLEEHSSCADEIEKRIGYQFNNRAYLLQAFTHPSYTYNRVTDSYQRLEFLGDAVLDFLLTVYIYENCGNLSPGDLTDLRSALVNNITFACLSVRYGLHTALLLLAPELFKMIDRFVKFQEERNHVVDDEILWILSEEDECRLAEHVDVPKALGDIFESVIGAVYLDSNKNLRTVWNVIYSLMKNEIDTFKNCIPKQANRIIYETPGINPNFSKAKITENGRSMVMLSIQCNGTEKIFYGLGATKKLAKVAASKQALKYLKYKR